MAKAVGKVKVTEKTVMVPTVQTFNETQVVLTLTEDEARTLVALLRSVGGPPEGPRGVLTGRKYTDDNGILGALTEVVGKWHFEGPNADGGKTATFTGAYIPAAKTVERYVPFRYNNA